MTTTTHDSLGRRVTITTLPCEAGTRLILTIYPAKAYAGRLEKASAHLRLELSPAQCRALVAGLSEYLDGRPAAGDADAGVPM